MPLTMKDTGLVQGVPLEGTPVQTFRVVKGFYDEQNQERRKGDIVQLSERFSKTLLMQGRIEPYAETKAPEPTTAPERQAPPAAPEPVSHEEEEIHEEEIEDDPVEEHEEEAAKPKSAPRKKGRKHR